MWDEMMMVLPRRCSSSQNCHHFDACTRVKPAGGFVQQKHLWIVDQHTRQAKSLLHTPAQCAYECPLLFGEANRFGRRSRFSHAGLWEYV